MKLDFPVVSFNTACDLTVGNEFPDFTRPYVKQEMWRDRSLSSLASTNPVCILFHSMIGSFPPIYLWKEVMNRGWIEKFDISVTAITASNPYEIRRFLDREDLPVGVFSDPANTVATSVGLAHDLDGMTGISEPRTAVVLVDEELRVQYRWVAAEWPEFPDFETVETSIAKCDLGT